jgi:multidrug efflux pump subunit AcrA (membrane-fusion protein)
MKGRSSKDAAVILSVTQEDITGISVGDKAKITLDAYAGKTFEGEVVSIDTSVSMGSATVNYSVKVQFTGDISGIYSGMTGQASFGVQSEDDVLYVSNQAVYQDGTEIYVQILEDNGEITKQKVTTGFSDGRNVEIVSGLEEGQKVIIESKVAS